MKKYKNKPIIIKATQFDGSEESIKELHGFIAFGIIDVYNDHLIIHSLKRDEMIVELGDYIIQTENNVIYPCKPYIFEQTYELINKEDY